MGDVARARVPGVGSMVRIVAVVAPGWRGPTVGALGALVCAAVLAAPAGAVPSAYVPVGDDEAAGVAQYTIAADGTLTAKTPSLIGPAHDLGDVALSPDGLSAYVSLTSSNPGTGPTTPGREVLQFDVDPATGGLTPKADPSVQSGQLPSALVAAPEGRSVYVVNTLDGTISQYDADLETGELSEKSPAAVEGPAGPTDIAVSPDGRSAYVSGFEDNTLAQFTIDPATGGLSPKTPPLVEDVPEPLGLGMTPDGRSLYAATTDGVAQFDVSPAGVSPAARRERRGHERRGARYAVIVQADEFLDLDTTLVAPTSTSALPASFRPAITLGDLQRRVLVEQTAVVDPTRLGRSAGRLDAAELRAVDEALALVLGI